MMMVLISGAQNYNALLSDFLDWQSYSPQPPTLILVPHGTFEDIIAGGVEDRRLTVDSSGVVKLKGVTVTCLCGALAVLPEFDCPATAAAREEVEETKPKELRAHDLPTEKTEKPTKAKVITHRSPTGKKRR